MQTPYIKISQINNRAYYMLIEPLEKKRINLRKKLMKQYADELYDYEESQLEGVLKKRFIEYSDLSMLIECFYNTTII